MKRSQVVCQLYLRNLRPDLYDYCVTNAVLPPERMSKFRLEKWIEDHRTAARAVVKLEPIGTEPTLPEGRGDAARERDAERMDYFRRLARATRETTRQDSITDVLIERPLSSPSGNRTNRTAARVRPGPSYA